MTLLSKHLEIEGKYLHWILLVTSGKLAQTFWAWLILTMSRSILSIETAILVRCQPLVPDLCASSGCYSSPYDFGFNWKLLCLCLSYFSWCWDTIPNTHKLKEEGLFQLTICRGFSHSQLSPRQGSMTEEQHRGDSPWCGQQAATSSNSSSGRSNSPFSFYPIQAIAFWAIATHTQNRSSQYAHPKLLKKKVNQTHLVPQPLILE